MCRGSLVVRTGVSPFMKSGGGGRGGGRCGTVIKRGFRLRQLRVSSLVGLLGLASKIQDAHFYWNFSNNQ